MDGHLRLHKVGDFAAPSLQEKSSKAGGTMEQLSGVMIIIIISGGVLTCLMLFIFAKRQIMRFQLRGRRGPHVPVGNDAKKALRREIERRLDCIQKITQEPKLLWNDGDKYIVQPEQDSPPPPYYYRMKAVDDVKLLEADTPTISTFTGCTAFPPRRRFIRSTSWTTQRSGNT